MVSWLFRRHGDLCASHPWEVIVATLTAAACALAVDREPDVPVGSRMPCGGWTDKCLGLEAEYHAADAVVMTLVRCLAILYSYYQFRNLSKFGSKNILAIAGMFAMVSSVVFTSSVINFLRGDISDLKDALFFFLLLIDVSKASLLARLALAAGSGHEVRESIGRGMELLGPPLTLDTLVEALLVGVGVLSGVPRLVALSWYACMSVVVNYVIFMTLYPACLSLVSELSNGSRIGNASGAGLLRALHAAEEEQKPNPVVQRVKLIMSAGLLLVHLHSRWSVKDEVEHGVRGTSISAQHNILNQTEETEFPPLMKLLTVSVEHLVILILVCALAAKFIFFEDREELNTRLEITATATSNNKKEEEAMETAAMLEPSIKHTISLANLSINDQVKIKKPIFDLSDSDTEDKETQTDEVVTIVQKKVSFDNFSRVPRSEAECLEIYRSELGAQGLSDSEVVLLVNKGHIPLYKLEGALGDPLRGVKLRRGIISKLCGYNSALDGLPYLHYDYSKVLNTCCENVIGYVGIPVGFAGPLIVDGVSYMVPMATTEGALVASTNRGAKALGPRGVTSIVEDIGMTRAPVVSFPNVVRASEARRWIETKKNYDKIKEAFDATSRFARLQEIHIAIDGPQLYIRFRATTGDAMGMNMVSKGAEMALRHIQEHFSDMTIISLSGNYCSDKKAAAINWVKGRGKRVVCEAIIDRETLKKVFKTDAKTLSRCNKLKNLSGSALAGTIGGNNAHAANMVTAIFIATGQDPAQNVTSSNCSTNMEPAGETGEDLYMTCTMPSLEVGTIGGGTILSGQSACLDLLGVRGAHPTCPAKNSKQLARIICATVLAGELSLMAALVNSDLVKSHMRHNRSSAAINLGASPIRIPTPSHRKLSPSPYIQRPSTSQHT